MLDEYCLLKKLNSFLFIFFAMVAFHKGKCNTTNIYIYIFEIKGFDQFVFNFLFLYHFIIFFLFIFNHSSRLYNIIHVSCNSCD